MLKTNTLLTFIAISILFNANIWASEEFIEKQDEVANYFIPGDAQYLEPYTINQEYLAVKVMSTKGYSPKGQEKVELSSKVLEEIINSDEFKNRVVNFQNRKGERKFASNINMSNEMIYMKLMEAREVLQPNTPNEINLYLQYYYTRKNTVGYTERPRNTIFTNGKFFNRNNPGRVAGNFAHEWTHKMGFDHRSAKEIDSVPYAIGRIITELANAYFSSANLN
jgi:hypothetical protein